MFDEYATVLFLDIDGVMTSDESSIEGNYIKFSPSAVELLNQIITRCNCGIVVTSTFRQIMSPGELMRYMRNEGVNDIFDRYLGPTPVLNTRADEIQTWLHRERNTLPYAILEDEHDLSAFADRVVYTKSYCGLTDVEATKVIQLLTAVNLTNPVE